MLKHQIGFFGIIVITGLIIWFWPAKRFVAALLSPATESYLPWLIIIIAGIMLLDFILEPKDGEPPQTY